MIDVLHLITRLDPGGSAENTLLTCRHLARRGWSVKLATGPGLGPETARVEETAPAEQTADAEGAPAAEGTVAAESSVPAERSVAAESEEEVDVAVVEVPALRRDPHPLADLRALAQILRLLRRERPAILHTHSAKAGILGRWAAFLARVPHVVHTPHGHVLYGYVSGWKNHLYNLAEKVTAPLTDRLVALSQGELRESVEHGIGRRGQWVVIHSGVPLDSVAPVDPGSADDHRGAPAEPVAGTGAGGRPLTVGSVARLEPVKGIDLLVEAAALLSEEPDTPDFRVEVWGEGSRRQALEQRIRERDLEERVLLRGCPGTVPSFLQHLDVYAQPSRNEGMGRALVLAQAASLPVVATRVCGIPDVVRHGETGLLANPEDPADLARTLGLMLGDDALRRRLAHNARPWVTGIDETGHARFSVEAMVHRIEALYRELTA